LLQLLGRILKNTQMTLEQI